jgi:hypothetical protein
VSKEVKQEVQHTVLDCCLLTELLCVSGQSQNPLGLRRRVDHDVDVVRGSAAHVEIQWSASSHNDTCWGWDAVDGNQCQCTVVILLSDDDEHRRQQDRRNDLEQIAFDAQCDCMMVSNVLLMTKDADGCCSINFLSSALRCDR